MDGASLNFSVAEPASMRFLYSMTVRPDQRNSSDPLKRRDDIASRVVLDGLAYRESGSALSLNCLIVCGGVLQSDFSLTVQPGQHNVKLQVKKFGLLTQTWRNDPALLDGYASSRTLIAVGERFDVKILGGWGQARTAAKDWVTVGNRSLTFHLDADSAVLFSYAMPTSQYTHPSYDSWSYKRWSSIGTRLVVDSIPYV